MTHARRGPIAGFVAMTLVTFALVWQGYSGGASGRLGDMATRVTSAPSGTVTTPGETLAAVREAVLVTGDTALGDLMARVARGIASPSAPDRAPRPTVAPTQAPGVVGVSPRGDASGGVATRPGSEPPAPAPVNVNPQPVSPRPVEPAPAPAAVKERGRSAEAHAAQGQKTTGAAWAPGRVKQQAARKVGPSSQAKPERGWSSRPEKAKDAGRGPQTKVRGNPRGAGKPAGKPGKARGHQK